MKVSACRAVALVAPPRQSAGLKTGVAVDQQLCLQAERRRGLRAGVAAVADGQASYQVAQQLGGRRRRGVDMRI